MVSLLRRPFGFAVLYTLLSACIAYLVINLPLMSYNFLTFANYASLVLFTIAYVLLVVAHLSHAFRLRASIYIPLLALIAGLVTAGIINPMLFVGVITNFHTWVNLAIAFVLSYALITLGNWLASFVFKSKGHI